MADISSKYFGNTQVGSSEIMRILMALKQNIMRDTHVATLAKVVSTDSEKQTVKVKFMPLVESESERVTECVNVIPTELSKDDIVIVLFADRNFRQALKQTKNSQEPSALQNDDVLHSESFGIAIAGIITAKPASSRYPIAWLSSFADDTLSQTLNMNDGTSLSNEVKVTFKNDVTSVNGKKGDVVITLSELGGVSETYFENVLEGYLTIFDADNTYATKNELANYALKTDIPDVSDFVTNSALNSELKNYLTMSDANNTYAKKSDIPDVSNFVTNMSLTETLSKYATTSAVESMLTSYVTVASFNTEIASIDKTIKTLDEKYDTVCSGLTSDISGINSEIQELENNINNKLDKSSITEGPQNYYLAGDNEWHLSSELSTYILIDNSVTTAMIQDKSVTETKLSDSLLSAINGKAETFEGTNDSKTYKGIVIGQSKEGAIVGFGIQTSDASSANKKKFYKTAMIKNADGTWNLVNVVELNVDIPEPPTTTGTYLLKATVSNSNIEYDWIDYGFE